MTEFLLDQRVIDKLYNEEFSSSLLLYWRKVSQHPHIDLLQEESSYQEIWDRCKGDLMAVGIKWGKNQQNHNSSFIIFV